MQYKIIVDKQPSSNPSDEKKEYIIDIEELRVKGDVYDSLNIEMDRTYVTRRLSISDFGVLSVLEEPVIEELEEVNIELFEGDNYIYLIDMQGNKFYAEYIIKNNFTDIYATKNEMNSVINQTAQSIELSVNQKLEGYSTTEEMNAAINVKANEINLELSKKVDDEELTGANIALRINEDNSSEAVIQADKININGAVSANGNFKIDTKGNMSCKNGNFNGNINITGASDDDESRFSVENSNGKAYITPAGMHIYRGKKSFAIDMSETPDVNIILTNNIDSNPESSYTKVSSTGITTPKLTQTSLESIKKNIEKFNKNAIEIIKNSDIYEYNLKSDKDTDKKMIGFIIGENYKTPNEVISKEGQAIGIYSMAGILWKAIQEQQQEIEDLKNKLKEVTNG